MNVFDFLNMVSFEILIKNGDMKEMKHAWSRGLVKSSLRSERFFRQNSYIFNLKT